MKRFCPAVNVAPAKAGVQQFYLACVLKKIMYDSVTRIVYFEVFDSALGAIRREKCLKEWARAWKICLIEKSNPEWRDLLDPE
jgi:predicted GIY-YIG superfamily endonuclease